MSQYDGELRHYGVLGMKWGIRRYQNEDGTLTAEGKRRNRNGGFSSAEVAKMSKNAYKAAYKKTYEKSINEGLSKSDSRKEAKSAAKKAKNDTTAKTKLSLWRTGNDAAKLTATYAGIAVGTAAIGALTVKSLSSSGKADAARTAYVISKYGTGTFKSAAKSMTLATGMIYTTAALKSGFDAVKKASKNANQKSK